MFLRVKKRFKDGKEHRHWSIVENRRTHGGRVVQRQVLYLGEINNSQKAAWCKTIEVIQEGQARPTQMAIFPEDRAAPALDWADENLDLKSHYQPLVVNHFCSGRSDI
jgi:hypothetical protein